MSKRDRKVSQHLRDLLNQAAPRAWQGDELGEPKTAAQVIAEKIIDAACAGEQWAIDLAVERDEGKAAVAARAEGAERSVEEQVSDVAREHVNGLALAAARGKSAAAAAGSQAAPARGVERPKRRARDRTAGAARADLDVPADGPGGAEDAGSESPLA